MRLSLVPQDWRFYQLFSRQGALVSDTLTELSKSLLEGRSRHPRLQDLEHECDNVTRELYELANRTFVAPLEHEDILALASSVDDIVDLAEEVGDKMELYQVGQATEPAKEMGEGPGQRRNRDRQGPRRHGEARGAGAAAAGDTPARERGRSDHARGAGPALLR